MAEINQFTGSREERVYQEAAALWRQVFGDAPPERVDGTAMLEIIMRSLPDEGYDRLRSPQLRPANIAWPAPRSATTR